MAIRQCMSTNLIFMNLSLVPHLLCLKCAASTVWAAAVYFTATVSLVGCASWTLAEAHQHFVQ